MRKEFRIALIFGLVQFLLSIVVWGGFEYTIASGDMVPNSGASFWIFLLEARLIPYIIFSAINMVFFGVLSIKLQAVFHPSYAGAVFSAVGTVVLAILLSLNSAFKVPYPMSSVVAFLVTSLIYGTLFRMINR